MHDTTGIPIRSLKAALAPAPHKPWLQVHGNIMYDLYYQSSVDTPFLEKDIYQHTVQTYLDITIKDQYPVRVAFSTQMGNSSLFRDITGLNLQYTNRDFRNALLSRLQSWDAARPKQLQDLQQLKAQLEEKAGAVQRLRSWLTAPSRLQQLVEARERELYGAARDSLSRLHMPAVVPDLQTGMRWRGLDTLKGYRPKTLPDTSLQRFREEYAGRQKQLDSLEGVWRRLDTLYRKQEQLYGLQKEQVVDKVLQSRNNKELADRLHGLDLPDTVLPKGYRTLLAIRSFGIGRTLVDYSDLTAKDISIQGIQAEYNPSYYVAVASGVIDYRFRNYIVNSNRPRQYLNLVRLGVGMKEGNNIIFTYYTGKKQVYNFNTTQGSTLPDYRQMGIAVEGRWQLNQHNYIIGEVAKSSLPYYEQSAQGQSKWGSMFRLSDHTNEAYSVKAVSFIPSTGTRVNAVYKVMGANFQSFSLFTTGSSQTAWSLRVDQPFFKQQLMVTASIRQNDYANHYQNVNYRSNTIFKSIQATLRKRKWPVLSVGYFPSSQLTKLSDDSYMENLFYTLVGSASHFYKYRGIMMNTMLSYTQFYNRQTDSSFVYFNSRNLLLNQTIFLGRLTVQGSLSSAVNSEYALYGADGNLQYKLYSWLDIGGGLKYSRQTVYDLQQVGYTGNARINIPRLGQLELMADKGFVPGVNRRLVSNNTGRLTYTRIF